MKGAKSHWKKWPTSAFSFFTCKGAMFRRGPSYHRTCKGWDDSEPDLEMLWWRNGWKESPQAISRSQHPSFADAYLDLRHEMAVVVGAVRPPQQVVRHAPVVHRLGRVEHGRRRDVRRSGCVSGPPS